RIRQLLTRAPSAREAPYSLLPKARLDRHLTRPGWMTHRENKLVPGYKSGSRRTEPSEIQMMLLLAPGIHARTISTVASSCNPAPLAKERTCCRMLSVL